jgi:predicted nucleotidyltransferase
MWGRRAVHPIIDQNRDAVTRLCELFGVEKLEVFGSMCTGEFDRDRSDIDLIASFRDHGAGYADRYLGFADAIEVLFGREVDVVTPYSIQSPLFRESVVSCRQVIYERASREAAA